MGGERKGVCVERGERKGVWGGVRGRVCVERGDRKGVCGEV